MKRPLVLVLVRLGAYLYFTVGAVGLLMGWFFAPLVLVLALALVGANWQSFQKPMSARRWVPLVAIASIGVVRILIGGPLGGGGAVLS